MKTSHQQFINKRPCVYMLQLIESHYILFSGSYIQYLNEKSVYFEKVNFHSSFYPLKVLKTNTLCKKRLVERHSIQIYDNTVFISARDFEGRRSICVSPHFLKHHVANIENDENTQITYFCRTTYFIMQNLWQIQKFQLMFIIHEEILNRIAA